MVPATIQGNLDAACLVGSTGGINAYDRILIAIAAALAQQPSLNAAFDGETLTRFSDINLGFAVDTPRGLVVPVIKRMQDRDAANVSAERRALTARVRAWKQGRDDLSGATFTVSNLGPLGIDYCTPVPFNFQVAIIGLGQLQRKTRQLAKDPAPVERWVLPVSLTFNHRVLDGGDGARFLKAVEAGISGRS